jgi:ribosome maturation factor RimP
MTSASLRGRLRETLAPVTAAAGFDLDEVTITPAGRRSVVRLVIDSDAGVSLDDVAEVASQVSSTLDQHDVVPGAYVLEVSSPGVDRPLLQPRHWRRNVGRLVQVSLATGGSVTGRIAAADDGGVALTVAGAPRQFGYADLRRGVVQVEFAAAEGAAEGAAEIAADGPPENSE